MLPKERVIRAITFNRPDRIPTGELGIDCEITERALGHPTLYRGKWKEYQAIWQGRRAEYVASCKRDIVALARHFEHDVVPVTLVPSARKPPVQPEFLDAYKWRMPDGRVYVYSPETRGNSFIIAAPRPRLEDLSARSVEIDESQLELVHHVVKEMGGTHFILARPPDDGIFPHDTYDMAFLLESMAHQPEVVERIIEIESRYNIALAEIMLDAGCDGVVTHNDVSGTGGTFMSPAMFRRFCLPWLKAWVEAAHKRGKPFVKHTDGNTWRILDMFVEAGVDGWHGIEPNIGMTLPRLQERYGGRLCFWGGVDLDTLVAGSEDEVVAQVREACASAPAEGGLVLTAGNSVMNGVQFELYVAMQQAARRYTQRQAVLTTP